MKLHYLSLVARVTIGVLAMVIAGTATLLFVENARLRDNYLKEQRTHLEGDLEVEMLRLNHAINTLRQDALFLSNTPPVSGIVRAALNHGYDARYSNTDKVWKERLQQIFSAFSTAHPDYFKIRYIGLADGGREIVRIDNRRGKIEITPPDKLQAEWDRDYFKATLGLHEGQVFFSTFNFSQEQGVIEQPYRPTLHASTPVFTPSGKMFGMVVISLDVANLLKSAVSDLPGVHAYMANSDGQYLLHPDLRLIFKGNIATDFPFIKTIFDLQAPDYLPLQVNATKTGSLLFAAKRIHFDPSTPSRFLLLMYYLPAAVIAEQVATIPVNTLIYEFMVMLLVGGIAAFTLRKTLSPIKKIAEAADKIAAGDQDTLLLPTGGGEIGSLTNALNTMLDKLSQRERLLRESESRYRRLHESMMDAYVMVGMSGRLLEFNHTYQKMLGYSAEELQHLTYIDLTPEKWHECEARIISEQVIPHGYSQVYEKEYIRKDGTVFPVELKSFLLRDKSGQPEAMWAIVRDITERKHADDELQKTQLNLLAAQQLAKIGSWEWDVRNNTAIWSDETYRLFEIDKSELNEHRKNFLNLVTPGDRIKVDQALSDALDGVKKYDIEYRICLAGGREKVIHALAETIRDTEGKAVVMRGTVQDITERKRVEILEQRFGRILQNSFNEIYLFDADTLRFLLISEGAEKNLGYSSDEVKQLTLFDLKPSLTRESFEQMIAPLRSGEQSSLYFEAVHRRKDGTTYPVEINLQLITTTTTTTTTTAAAAAAFLAIVQDITERKQAEDRQERLLAKTLVYAKEVESLYNQAPCGYHSLDRDGIIIRINDTELAWLGYARDEAIGKMKLMDFFTPVGRKNFHETFPQLQEQGFIHDIEVEIIRKDGTVFTGLINATAVYGPSGDFVMSRSTMTDITARKRMEQQLHNLNAHLQSVREEEKISIARELHDDLGGTLTALNMRTHILKTELSAHQETASFLDHIEGMLQLIDGAMGIMRGIISGLRPTILDDLGILAALEWQAAQFQKLNGIECRVNCICATSEGCVRKLDKLRSIALFRIAQEALTNAAKHSGASLVEIEFLNNDDEVVMSIIDNGRGMTKNRTGPSIPYGILGMRERVDQLGGMIGFDTPPGGGFSVTVILLLPANE